jgi:hypothetical protein
LPHNVYNVPLLFCCFKVFLVFLGVKKEHGAI